MNTFADAFIAACTDELAAPKPGNVHHFAGGHRMEAQDFILSAQAAAGPLTAPGATVGERIYGAIDATFARVGQNTNLGIVLLCAPLAQAASAHPDADLATGVARVLRALDRGDADLAFKAITLANPAGLGAARHDVTQPARVTLLDAMREAAPRDRVARQYATDFEDVFTLGAGALGQARQTADDPALATLTVYLAFLGAFPDSHVQRKFGASVADGLVEEARAFRDATDLTSAETAFPSALKFDADLKARGLNPGTSADLTVATLFADYLRGVLANGCKNG